STLAVFVELNAVHLLISAAIVVAFLVVFRWQLLELVTRFRQQPEEHRRVTLIVLIAAVAAMFPTCLIPQLISENQTALPLAFVVLLTLACPLGGRSQPSRDPATVKLTACLCALALVWLASACFDKVLAARDASIRARNIGDVMVSQYESHPSRHV